MKSRKARLEGDLISIGTSESCTRHAAENGYESISKVMDQVIDSRVVKERRHHKCENYPTLSLICHANKIILEIIRRRMKNTIETQIGEKQAGILAGRGTIEKIFPKDFLQKKSSSAKKKELY